MGRSQSGGSAGSSIDEQAAHQLFNQTFHQQLKNKANTNWRNQTFCCSAQLRINKQPANEVVRREIAEWVRY